MTITLPEPIAEALKEGGRIVLLGVVSYLLTDGIIELLVEKIIGTKLDATVKTIVSGVILSVLRSVDKWIHGVGKEQEELTGNVSKLTLGLTRF